MLPKNRKISRRQFPNPRSGIKKNTEHFSLLVSVVQEKDKARCSVVVSGKVAKSSALRNKLRRRAYSVMEEVLPLIPDGYRIIFFARAGAPTLPYRHIESEIKELLTAARVPRTQ